MGSFRIGIGTQSMKMKQPNNVLSDPSPEYPVSREERIREGTVCAGGHVGSSTVDDAKGRHNSGEDPVELLSDSPEGKQDIGTHSAMGCCVNLMDH